MDDPRTTGDDGFPDLADWEGWLRHPTATELPQISADFVDRTLQRIRDDGPGLGRAAIESYRVPEPSVDFVDRTAARVREARASWQRTLAGHRVPQPSLDFVERTLKALGIARHRPATRWTLGRVAAVLLVAVGVGVLAIAWPSGSRPGSASVASVPDADAFSPTPWATALAHLSAGDARLVRPDPLLLATLDGGD